MFGILRQIRMRLNMSLSALFALAGVMLFGGGCVAVNTHTLDLSGAQAQVRDGYFKMGTAASPGGATISVNSQSLLFNGKPWLPAMGEFHFARCAEREWRDELLKMKAGGIKIVSTYVFWIHHEELEGEFDWSGQRSLRRFTELCNETGMLLIVRLGPWCHGEARNGGLPDWIFGRGFRTRTTAPEFLEKVRILYNEIGKQLHGLFWKDGGPVIGVQVDNEYSGPAEYLLALKQIAIDAGFDVPLYTRTGWPELRTPIAPGELLPLESAYAEGFWDRVLEPMPGKYWKTFAFENVRGSTETGTDQLGRFEPAKKADYELHPYLMCETGGGMARSYHRRIYISPSDVYSGALVQLGNGSNLPGYYMYHGGINPEGRRTTLNESQATNDPNDMPVLNYDWGSPLSMYGERREHYHLLRRLHMFQNDFGEQLATMKPVFPEAPPAASTDTATLRWAVRSDGHGGYLFVNNYQRLQAMPAKENTQFELRLMRGDTLRIPAKPITIPADSSFFWPFNLDLDGVNLVYATAQPLCRAETDNESYFIFKELPGIPAEFLLDVKRGEIDRTTGNIRRTAAGTLIQVPYPGREVAIQMYREREYYWINIIVLNEIDARNCWKGLLNRMGSEDAFITQAGLIIDEGSLRLSSNDPDALNVSILPGRHRLILDGRELAPTPDGAFGKFSAPTAPAETLIARVEQIREAGPLREIKPGRRGMAEAPADAEFADAAAWSIRLPEGLDASRRLLLRVCYVGDVARVTLGGKLLIDDFYNGQVFEIGINRYAPEIFAQPLTLEILPLQQDAPILLPADAIPDFGDNKSIVKLQGVEIVEYFERQFSVTR